MAADPGMAVMCSLYRSNRLTALVRTVPQVVVALGHRLREALTEFWREHPRTDLQFRSEAEAFCAFVRQRYASEQEVQRVVDHAEAALAIRFAEETPTFSDRADATYRGETVVNGHPNLPAGGHETCP